MWSFKDKNPGIQLSHFIILCAGAFLGSIVTQIISPGGNWENCRHVGISTPNPTALTQSSSTTATQSSSPPLELLFAGAQNGRELRLSRVKGTYNITTPFKGPPTVSVDQAWQQYWRVWTFTVDEHAYRLSKPQHPEAGVQVPTAGGRRYLATFAATHQLHCLYNLFRATYLDSYDDERSEYERDPVAWHQRVDHCVDILRQKLECDRDTTLVTYNWVKRKRGPVANFNVARQCAAWNDMDRWAQDHEVEVMPAKPEDAVQLNRIP